MTAATWVFGYGSLVSPGSVAGTVGRPVDPSDGWMVARLTGFGRRWNYGSLHLRGDWQGPGGPVVSGIVISLGLVPAHAEHATGVLIRVDEDDLARLDQRERDYDRTDVTDRVAVADGAAPGRVVTYVPRSSAIERYVTARDAGRAAVRRAYWDLVHTAFADLGPDHLAEFTATTPPPDVPVLDILLTAP